MTDMPSFGIDTDKTVRHYEAVFHVGDVVRKLRLERKWTLDDLVKEADVSRGTLSLLEQGKSNTTKSVLEKVAKALGTTVPGLYGLVGKESIERSVRRTINGYIDAGIISDVDPERIDVSGHKRDDIPVIAEGDASPQPDLFWDNAGVLYADVEDRITRPYDVQDPIAYGVRVRGDSMLPIYRAGQELVVSPNTAVADGDEVYVQLLSGERLLKIAYHQSNGWVLESANPAYKPRFVLTADVGAIHPILWARRKRRGQRIVHERRRDQPRLDAERRGPTAEPHPDIADHPDEFPEAAREDGDPTFDPDDES